MRIHSPKSIFIHAITDSSFRNRGNLLNFVVFFGKILVTKKKFNVPIVLFIFLFFIQPVFSDIGKCNYSIDGTVNTTFQSSSSKTSNSSTSSGTFVWDTRLNGSLSLKFSDNLIFCNDLNLGYGQINIRNSNSKSWSKPSINSDFINFNSMIRYDNMQNNFAFVQLKYCSSFFDQTNTLHFNPYTMSVAAGATFNYSTENLYLPYPETRRTLIQSQKTGL